MAEEDENQEEQLDQHSRKTEEDDVRRGPISFGDDEDPTKIRIEKNPGEIISGTYGFIRSILSLRRDRYDVPGVVKEIQSAIEFKGYNVWILMCSIIVASVGLNFNSTAVIVGAMLISPLMGPIRGIGFGVAMNDFPMLTESVRNFGITVFISLSAATIYFFASPIHALTPELEARTAPNFMDAVIAFFGGLAGVIAAAKGKNDTVIPGVAIATALMPPLCTAGYGIANGEWTYLLGASYLFLLNSLLIALSTILFIRYLKFPKKQYVNPKIERKVQNYIVIFMVVIISPSIYLFYKMAKKSIFEANAEAFVTDVVRSYDENLRMDTKYDFNFKEPVITLNILNNYFDSSTVAAWDNQMDRFGLEDAKLVVVQGEDLDAKLNNALNASGADIRENNAFLREAYMDNQEALRALKEENDELEKLASRGDPLDLGHMILGFKEEYPELKDISIDRRYSYKNQQIDTSYVMGLSFKPSVEDGEKDKLVRRIQKRFLFEIQQKTTIKQDSLPVILSE